MKVLLLEKDLLLSAYPQIKSSDNLSWGLRLEYMMIDTGSDDINVLTPTLTANYLEDL